MNNFDLCEEKSLSIISCCAYSFQELYQASVHRVTKLSGCLIQHCTARLSTTTPRQHQITINMPSFNDSPLLQILCTLTVCQFHYARESFHRKL